MTPAPPVSLLPPRHEWRVIIAPEWRVARGLSCNAADGDGQWPRCGELSVAACMVTDGGKPTPLRHGEPRCARHLGSIRWIDGEHVMQWRAVATEPLGVLLCDICVDPIGPGETWGLTAAGAFTHRSCGVRAIRAWVGRGLSGAAEASVEASVEAAA